MHTLLHMLIESRLSQVAAVLLLCGITILWHLLYARLKKQYPREGGASQARMFALIVVVVFVFGATMTLVFAGIVLGLPILMGGTILGMGASIALGMLLEGRRRKTV